MIGQFPPFYRVLGAEFWSILQLLARKRPYEGYPGAEAVRALGPTIVTLWAAEGQRPAFPPGTPKEWSNLCTKCWAESPLDRPHFEAIAQELRAMHPGLLSWPDPDRGPEPEPEPGPEPEPELEPEPEPEP